MIWLLYLLHCFWTSTFSEVCEDLLCVCVWRTRKKERWIELLLPCCWSCFLSLLSTLAFCYVALLLSIIIAHRPAVTQTQFGWHRQVDAGGKWIWGHFKWPVLLLATLKGWSWPVATQLAYSLRFRKKLTGKKKSPPKAVLELHMTHQHWKRNAVMKISS